MIRDKPGVIVLHLMTEELNAFQKANKAKIGFLALSY